MKEGSASYKWCFIYLLFGLSVISIVSAGQFAIPERDDISKPSWWVVDIDQSKIPSKGLVVKEKTIWPLLHLLPPIIAWLIFIITYTILRRRTEKTNQWSKPDNITPHAFYFICQSLIFLLVCLIFTLFEKRISSVLSYGRIPAFYHAILGIIMAFPICVDRWFYYQKRLWQIENLTAEPLDNFRRYIERILKTINRFTLILLVTVALGTWNILGGEFSSLTPPETYYHTIEIAIGFVICAIAIIFWILKPLFDIFQNADLAYFRALLKDGAVEHDK